MIIGILLIVIGYLIGDIFWGRVGLGLLIVVAVGVVVAQFLRKTITLILGGLLTVVRFTREVGYAVSRLFRVFR